MKPNLYDLALEGIGEIIELVSDSIVKEFKGVTPFDKEAISTTPSGQAPPETPYIEGEKNA